MSTNTATKTAAAKLCTLAGFESEGDGVFTSRKGGNGTDAEPAAETLQAANDLIKKIRALGLTARREICDEWVSVVIA